MPPKLQLTNKLLSAPRQPFVCSSCLHKLASFNTNGLERPRNLRAVRWKSRHARYASTIPSVTAVNVKREVPAAFQAVHASLKVLEHDAGVYVNTSQLQLALRGVESDDAITRVAVLGLNGHSGARRLTRALLADPLAAEQDWERKLTDIDESDGKAMLLRYSENTGFDDRHPLVRTLSIPSLILQSHKLEILIHTISSADKPSNEGAASLLVPSIEITNSASGKPGTVTYPVHKTLMYEEGLKSFETFAAIETQADQLQEGRMFKGVIDWSWSTIQQNNKSDEPIAPINLALAEAAIETFRRSLEKSMEYEHMWFDAGMPALSSWLLEGTAAPRDTMKTGVRRLVQSICDKASLGISGEELLKSQQEKATIVPIATRNIIGQGITIWAENAHTELRDRLNAAFDSKSWRRTKWWKLFWRVDDVAYVASEVLQRAWLVEAEKEMIWLSGRIHQSGLLGPPKLRPTPPLDPEDEEPKLGRKPPASSAADLIPQASSFSEPSAVQHPWPQDIARARSTLCSLTVPPLQTLSQALVLQTISTNVLTSSLSALLYVSISTTSPYESGAIAAVGLVWSLRRLQKKWEVARSEWEAEVREEGRRVLRLTEHIARETVEDVQPEVDEVGQQQRAVAREAVRSVKTALDDLEG